MKRILILSTLMFIACARAKPEDIKLDKQDHYDLLDAVNEANILARKLQAANEKINTLAAKQREKYKCAKCDFTEDFWFLKPSANPAAVKPEPKDAEKK